MGRAQSDTYSSMFNKSDNVNVDETFVQKSLFVHVLSYTSIYSETPQDVIHELTNPELTNCPVVDTCYFRIIIH